MESAVIAVNDPHVQPNTCKALKLIAPTIDVTGTDQEMAIISIT